MNIPPPVVSGIQKAIDLALQLNPQNQDLLTELDQKIIQLHIRGLELDIFLIVVDGQVEVAGQFDGEADTVISGSPFALAGLSKDLQGMFRGDVGISGDMTVGKNVKRLLTELEIDWEDQLAQFVGGTAAHQLGRIHRELFGFASRTVTNFQQNTSEYLTEESQLLITSTELQRFLNEVDEIRADTDRLFARLNLLEKRKSGERG